MIPDSMTTPRSRLGHGASRFAERRVRDVLSAVGVTVNGNRSWDPQIHDSRFYRRIMWQGSLGLGESYVEGWWDVEELDRFFEHVLIARDPPGHGLANGLATNIRAHFFNLQTRRRAFRVAEAHYDLGNDLFVAMLDPRMIYTCADWRGVTTLAAAQEAKLEAICRKLRLEPGIRLLDIGCGWGGLAKYAVERYSVSVVGITVSKEQLDLGRQLCEGLPIDLKLLDYRDLDGTFDAVASIGMLEAVGHKNYGRYMRTVANCLVSGGSFVLQTIGQNNSRLCVDPWIEKYIFPNGEVPSMQQIAASAEDLMVIEDVENLGVNYAKTLNAWFRNFDDAWPKLSGRHAPQFYRTWKYYLLSCAGAFSARHLQVWQCVLSARG